MVCGMHFYVVAVYKNYNNARLALSKYFAQNIINIFLYFFYECFPLKLLWLNKKQWSKLTQTRKGMKDWKFVVIMKEKNTPSTYVTTLKKKYIFIVPQSFYSNYTNQGKKCFTYQLLCVGQIAPSVSFYLKTINLETENWKIKNYDRKIEIYITIG